MNTAGYYGIAIALAAYYFFVWLMVGRKPRHQSIVVRYQPPGLSPAALRYVFTLGCDGRTLAAVLTQLAARGVISINPTRDAVYLTQLQKERHSLERLSDEERLVLKNVFQWADFNAELQRPDPDLIEKLQESIQTKAAKYFKRNTIYVVMAVVASAAATTWMSLSLHLFGHDLFDAYVIASFTGLTVGMFIAASVYLWDKNFLAVKLALRGLYRKRVIPLLFFFVLLFPAMWYFLMRSITPTFANATALLILINMFAAPALRNYTVAGRQLYYEILGFRQFLQQAEQDRLKRLNPTDQAMQADQEFLPYAIALDVREDWGDELGARTMIETAL